MARIEELSSNHLQIVDDKLTFSISHNDEKPSTRYNGLSIKSEVTVSITDTDLGDIILSPVEFTGDTEVFKCTSIPLVNMSRGKFGTSIYHFEKGNLVISLEVSKGITLFDKLALGNSYDFLIMADMS